MSGDLNDKQVKAMGDIIRALNTGMGEEEPLLESGPTPLAVATHSHGHVDGNVEAMRSILGAFREATDMIREDAEDDPMLMEALCTERTTRGVRIAEWEIVVTDKKGMGKYYDVINDDLAIATDLRLYEAALLLTQELNRGSSITSDKVRQILSLEAHYARNLDDAIRYSRIVKVAEGAKKTIASSRLTEAKAKAIAAKEQINELR